VPLPTRTEWQRFRDNHADSPGKGAVTTVSVGKLLDEAEGNVAGSNFKKKAAVYGKVAKGFKTYHDKVKKKHPRFAADFKADYLDEAVSLSKSTLAMVNPAKALKENIVKAAVLAGGMTPASTHRDYETLYGSDPVRLISMNLGTIVRNDPTKRAVVDPIKSAFQTRMDKILPSSVDDNPATIWAAVTKLRKALLKLKTEAETADLL
jgi:hypothetical protein